MNNPTIEFDYITFNKIAKEMMKDMRKQEKMNLGLPEKVVVYKENGKTGWRYEYKNKSL